MQPSTAPSRGPRGPRPMQHAHSFASFRSHKRERGATLFPAVRGWRVERLDDGQLHHRLTPQATPLSERLSNLAAELEGLAKSERGGQYVKRASRPKAFAVAALLAKQAREDRIEARRRRHAHTMASAAGAREVSS